MKRKKALISIIVVTALLVLCSILTNRNILTTNLETLGQSLGIITLVPTVLSVVLAFISHNVLFSLLIGVLSGVLILGVVYTTSVASLPVNLATQLYATIKNVVFDIDNIEILLLCFVVGGMIEVVKSSGGFEALAIKLTKKVNSPLKANLLASILGMLVMFDDYANTLIVGPIMKPITDRVKVSREKLSFVVDSTAAPISGIVLVSSWIGVEIASIEKGLEIAGAKANSFSLFLKSIPFCFYCIFAITFIFINSLIGKDFGPMLKAEMKARKGQIHYDELDESANMKDTTKNKKRIFVGVGSVVLLIFFAVVSFYVNGKANAINNAILPTLMPLNIANITKAISYADTVNLITTAALIGTVFTILFGCVYKLFTFKEALQSWFKGTTNMGKTVLMLVFAWMLADVVKNLGTTYFVVEIISMNVNPLIVPILIYASCCLISCASGSFGCMFVVMPLAIPLAFKMNALGTMISDEMYLLICVGSVIAGSIFGDHCSPIADCTILAATGCGVDTMEHCYTQLPYTIVNCLIAAICGILLTSLGINVYISLLIGIITQALIMLLLGKKPI